VQQKEWTRRTSQSVARLLRRVLGLLKQVTTTTADVVAQHLRITRTFAQDLLERLVEDGKAQRVDSSPQYRIAISPT